MNWVDLVVLAVLAVSGLLAFMRGLVREVLGLGAWVIAAVVASSYGVFPLVHPWVAQQFADPTTATLVAFGGVFILTLIVLWLVSSAIAGAIRNSVLGGLDRTLGFVFGLVRGAVLVCVLYVVVGMAIPAEQWPSPVIEARALPLVHRGAVYLADQVRRPIDPRWRRPRRLGRPRRRHCCNPVRPGGRLARVRRASRRLIWQSQPIMMMSLTSLTTMTNCMRSAGYSGSGGFQTPRR